MGKTKTYKKGKYNITINYLNQLDINDIAKEIVDTTLIPKILEQINNKV